MHTNSNALKRVSLVLALAAIALTFASSAAAALPSSMAALGDSLTRGFGATGTNGDAPSESWATGTNSAVSSHYRRLLSENSAISGNNFNDAQSGTKMSATLAQASSATAQGAEYVTIWSGTNDVCTPTTAGMTSVS
jgi:lysophospholipase L1-like esterase